MRDTTKFALICLTLISTLLLFFLLLFLFFLFLDAGQLQRLDGHDFEVGATLRAGDNLPLVNLILFDIQIAFTFRTNDHNNCLRFLVWRITARYLCIYI